MSFDIVKTLDFPQAAFQYAPQEILGGNAFEDFATLGGILSDLKHLWHAKGPCLEVRNIVSGRKVGSWTFGGILNDSNTKIVAVDELKRPHGRLPLLVVALECTISGGLVCVFDIFGSKVLRVVQVREQITCIHVIDSGCENSVLPEPSSLRYFDGIVAIGTLGGNVFLLDLCRQICENGIHNAESTLRDELNPCPMIILNKDKIINIKKYVERSVDREEHLAVHINVVLDSSTEHFTLKGEKGEDRVHVNRSETEVSSLFYSPQIASLLVGYNFGAFQLWDLRSLELAYTSPICEEHIPVMQFAVQEPADDPKAYCYIWVSYSHNLRFHSGLPFAVMYSFYYENKNYVNGYGNLYEDFQHCSVRFQIELGEAETPTYNSRVKGGTCKGLQSLNKYPVNKELHSMSLCVISWLVWNGQKEVSTSVLVFDLNQWYKEQMPRAPNWADCSNYIIKHGLPEEVLDVKLDQKSLSQFLGIQRLEEHFCPTSLSFDLWCITDKSILKVHNKGQQQAFIDKIVEDQHLSLVRPEDYFEQITSLGLVPLFCEIHLSNSLDIDHQREILLDVALEQKLIGWLCKSTAKLANNAYNASGLTIYNILNWAFERAITLKNACDKYCVSLFDHSGVRLDNNTVTLLNSSTGQIRNICSLYRYVSGKLMGFVSDKEALLEEQRSLENVVVYFEVLLWMVNIGLLPERQLNNYQTYEDSAMTAPYLVQDLTQYYDRKRAQLQMASHETFVDKDCLLFVDNLINIRGGAEILRQQWQEDGGSGLYPPPSLQSVLRTYFLDGPDLVFKHCLVTYTLLDIAMTVDESNKIIKLLLKFPQIFDLSQSNIKIVQAFWHLDHDDYETALEYILDPCVLTEDLQHWHHSVMMRSLLLQDQSSLALLYLQIRKPSIQDEKDLLTVISLLISKNMLDEAFKFRQQHQNPNEQALLLHIFNECNKNELLHSLLYRRLENSEEQAFFRYLQNTKNPRCEDLKVFYYLLRSRFLEAFDSYASINRKKPENQGLIGQRDATTADSIVKLFKTLLPDVNKNLVDLVRKERTNLWKEVRKPTPLSVFVHNARDHVQYKSSVIFAALAKAKQTFNDTLNDTRWNGDVVTEETPFLRTPTICRAVSMASTPLMKSRVIEQNEQGEEYGPSPCKKLKLSPRTSKTSPVKSRNLSLSTIQSKLSTPIIKRKRLSTEAGISTSVLPQSILKGSSATRTILDDSIFDENTSVNTSLQLECENSVRRSRLALTPRKPVSRTPIKSHVKFDDLRYSNSSNEQSGNNESPLYSLLPETKRSLSVNSTTSTVDEIFYSPDNSPEPGGDGDDDDKPATRETTKSLSPARERLSFDETVTGEVIEQQKQESEAVKIPVGDLSINRLTFQSPRSRRSYKRSFGESPVPVRSSPRLARKASPVEEDESAISETTLDKSEPVMKPSPSIAVQKLRGRKSLTRAVLEHNTFSKVTSSHIFEQTKSGRSSFNTSVDTESEMDMEESHEDSIEELLEKYRTSALGSISTNDSLLSDTGRSPHAVEEGGVGSKSMEVRSIEVHKESIRKSLVKEYRSEKIDNSVEDNVFEETMLDFNVKSTVDDEKSEPGASELSEDQELSNHDESRQRDQEITVYEDLSSGSDDVTEVLRQYNKKENDEQIYTDISFSTSLSYYQNEKKDERMPDNFMDSGGSNLSANESPAKSSHHEHVYDNDIDMEELDDDIPVTEKAFIDSGAVIEIVSSSDEDDHQKGYDESSRSSTSSSSKDTVNSSKEESNDYNINVAFENNLNEAAVGSILDKTNEEEDLDEKTEEVEDTAHAVLVESSDSLLVDDTHQFELDQIEIAAAVRMLQTDGLAEEQQDVEADEEHMDSLILEQSPEDGMEDDLESKIGQFGDKNEDQQGAVSETRKAIGSDGIFKENLEVEDAIVKPADSVIQSSVFEEAATSKEAEKLQTDKNIQQITEQENEATTDDVKQQETPIYPQKHSRSLQCTLGINDSITDSVQDESINPEEDRETLENATQKEASPLKKSKSLQCTLGINDIIMDTTVGDYTSNVQGEDKSMVLNEDSQSQKDSALKGTSSFPQKQSKSLQCTLGVNDSIMELLVDDASVSLKDNENVSLDKTTPPPKQSKSLQCTLGVNDSVMQSYVDDTSVFLREEENMDLDKTSAPQKQSKSLQCTLGINDSIIESFVDDTSVFLRGDENMDLDKTSALQKQSKSLQCTLGVNDSIIESFVDDTSVFIREDENIDLDKTSAPQKQSKSLQCTLGVNDSIMESYVDDTSILQRDNENMTQKNKTVDLEEQNKKLDGAETKEKESVVQESPPKEEKLETTASTEGKEGAEASEKQDSSKPKSEEATILTPSRRMTRRRSLLLTQQDGTPSSTSEKSVSTTSGDKARLEETKDESTVLESSDEPGPSKILSRRSSKNDEPSSSLKQHPRAPALAQPKKRTRSASVDQPSAIIQKRSIRSKSIDLDDMNGPTASNKSELLVMLTPIKEQAGPSTDNDASEDEASKHTGKAYSDVGAYTTSRRLTRRQASMLKAIGKVEKAIMEEINPLLEKEEFDGPDESKVYEQSPPSTTSSGTPSRNTRSASVVSDVPGTPKRKSKAKIEHVDSPISGIKARLRKQSTDTMSVTSEKSDSPSPSKRAKKKEEENEGDNDSQSVKGAKRGRSRASSVSSTKSAASDKTDSSVRTTRSRRLQSAKSDLLEIKEEKDSEEGDVDTSVIKKRGRKKKI